MNKNIIKGIGAVVAGLLVAATLSNLTDFILEKIGVISYGAVFDTWRILLLLAYRTVYNCLGFYTTLLLAPKNKETHAYILASIGVTLGLIGTYLMRAYGPIWYGLGIAVLSIPALFVAINIYNKKHKKHSH